MALPPRPKQPLLVRRVLALSTLAAGCSHPVPPQVVREPNEMHETAPPPQVNCAGSYAGECRGELTIVVRDEAGATVANVPVTVMVRGEPMERTTDAQGTVVVGATPGEGLAPGDAIIKIDAAGYAPVEQTASIDAGPVRVDVVLRRPAP